MVRRAPNNKLGKMSNPLYQYEFHVGGMDDKRDWDSNWDPLSKDVRYDCPRD